MGRIDLVVSPGESKGLEEAKEEFEMVYEDGLRMGVLKFRILLEPLLAARATDEQSGEPIYEFS